MVSFRNWRVWHDRSRFRMIFGTLGPMDPRVRAHMESHDVECLDCDCRTRSAYPRGLVRIVGFLRRQRIDILHTHLFDPSVVGLVAGRLAPTPARVVTRHYSDYHTRIDRPLHVGLGRLCTRLSHRVPDEMVDGGFWAEGSPMHRVTRSLERRLYGDADSLIVLSSRAARRVDDLPPVRQRGTPVIVVPSCVDLQRFVPRPESRFASSLRLVYMGAVGGRYELDRIGRFVAVWARRTPVRLLVLTREPRDVVAGMLAAA